MVWPFNRLYNTWNVVPSFEETNNPGYDEMRFPAMPEVAQPIEKDRCYYTVGRTLNGSTVLRVQSDDNVSSMTLTMDTRAVNQLIRLLQATITEEDENESE